MNIAITFRQMEATEAVKQYATDKVAPASEVPPATDEGPGNAELQG